MAVNQYLIQQVVNSNSIREYLKNRGIVPKKVGEQSSCYCCPLPSHNDKTPSFHVYHRDGQCENFYCFGCHSSGDIISLNAAINEVSWGQSLYEFSKDQTIDKTSLGRDSYILKKIKNDMKQKNEQYSEINDIGLLSWKISNRCRNYATRVNFDKNELLFLENLYKQLDKFIENNDLDSILKINDYIETPLDYKSEDKRTPFDIRFDNWSKNNKI